MPRLTQILEDHHRHCDDSFAAAEAAAQKKRWEQAAEHYKVFHDGMESHFGAEETLLFPAFESIAGEGGPTQVMRSEHTQMRALLTAMAEAIQARDADEYAGQAETLLIMMQQHNLKEENILYPMCDSTIPSTEGPRLTSEIQKALH
jgi:DUF438 domain-containing protein